MRTLSEPARLVIRGGEGGMDGATGHYEKRLSELAGLYLDAAAHAAAVGRHGIRWSTPSTISGLPPKLGT